MVDTFYRKNGHPSFISYCFIGIFQNRDTPPPTPGARTNRGTMLKRSWHTPIMVDTSHRKYEHPSFIIYCFIEIFQNSDPPLEPRLIGVKC